MNTAAADRIELVRPGIPPMQIHTAPAETAPTLSRHASRRTTAGCRRTASTASPREAATSARARSTAISPKLVRCVSSYRIVYRARRRR